MTILCYSRMRYVVMQAVQTLEKQGFDPEVSQYYLVCQNALQHSPHSNSCAQGCCTVVASLLCHALVAFKRFFFGDGKHVRKALEHGMGQAMIGITF